MKFARSLGYYCLPVFYITTRTMRQPLLGFTLLGVVQSVSECQVRLDEKTATVVSCEATESPMAHISKGSKAPHDPVVGTITSPLRLVA